MISEQVPSARERGSRVAFRRGVSLLAMTLLLPGSAQLVAGGRALGRAATRTWLVTVSVVAAFALLFVLQRGWAISLYASPLTQWLLAGFFLAAGAGWALLFLDALRLSRPRYMESRRAVALTVVSVLLAAAAGAGGAQASAMARAQADLFGNVFGGGGTSKEHDGRINVLLVGADADAHRDGIRTDTLIVASISARTGRIVLFSLPRNLQHTPFPASSPLRQLYPNGYWCADEACLLNAVYAEGRAHADLYPGVTDPGMAATREAVEETLGLTLNYHAMVDLRGFSALIDAVGGINLDIARPVPIGGGTSRIKGYIEPGRNVHLNGYHALWFARSRAGSSDYERMARQKCVINAMVKQLEPVTVVARFGDIASAGGKIVETDVPTGDVGGLLELAAKGRNLPLASTSFAPPLIVPVKPDLPFIRRTVEEAVDRSEQLDREAARTPAPTASAAPAKPTPKPKKVTVGTSPTRVTAPEDTTRQTDDLEAICGVAN